MWGLTHVYVEDDEIALSVKQISLEEIRHILEKYEKFKIPTLKRMVLDLLLDKYLSIELFLEYAERHGISEAGEVLDLYRSI